MLKNVFLFLSIFICSFQASQVECSQLLRDDVQNIFITPKDVICENDNIFVEFEGGYYPVRSLEKQGKQWLATIDMQNAFCPRGHNVCRFCYQCHVSGCTYAVLPPCWVRK